MGIGWSLNPMTGDLLGSAPLRGRGHNDGPRGEVRVTVTQPGRGRSLGLCWAECPNLWHGHQALRVVRGCSLIVQVMLMVKAWSRCFGMAARGHQHRTLRACVARGHCLFGLQLMPSLRWHPGLTCYTSTSVPLCAKPSRLVVEGLCSHPGWPWSFWT